jgi:hypothetical protein
MPVSCPERCMRVLPASLLLLVALPLPGLAEEAFKSRFAVTPLLGYRVSNDFPGKDDQDVGLDDSSVIGLMLSLPAEQMPSGDYTEWELYVSHQSVDVQQVPAGVDPGLDIDITHVLLGGAYIGPGDQVRPFLSAGIGAARLSPGGSGYDSDTVFAFGIGGGAQFFPERRIGLRLEARALGSVIDSNTDFLCASGPEANACAFRSKGDVLWQWEVSAGLVARF